MADIKQAAKWMQEGKRVRRTNPYPVIDPDCLDPYEHGLSLCANEHGTLLPYFPEYCGPMRANIRLDSLLADDWEIAE